MENSLSNSNSLQTLKEKSSTSRKAISLSAALKDLKSNWTPAVADAFAAVGISYPDELTPARFLSLMARNKKKDKKTGKYVVGVWGERKVRDYDGFPALKSDGTYQTERVLRKVGSWTKRILWRVLEQNGIVLTSEVTTNCNQNNYQSMEETKTKLIKMFPDKQELRDKRTYIEANVKKILYSFARDLGCKWRKKKLEAYIETAFDFD